ncbi:MAG: transglycosylase SLT domain-containing protein [bacterium]
MTLCARVVCLMFAAIALGTGPSHAAPAQTVTPAAAFRDGAAKFAQGRIREAEAIFARITRQAPRDPYGWVWLGIVRYHRGDHRGAEAAFEAATRLAPRDGKILIWRAHALLRLGDVAEAQAAFERARLVSSNAYVRELAAQALRAMRPAPAIPGRDEASGSAARSWAVTVQGYRNLARYYNPRLTLAEADVIAQSLLAFSKHYNLDPRLIVALVVIESGFQPRARSHAGAMGLGQLMPETARALGVDPYDPAQNLYGTIRYLRGNLDRFGWDNVHLALAAYNAGRGAVERYEGIPPYDETRWYVYNVSNLYRRLLSL